MNNEDDNRLHNEVMELHHLYNGLAEVRQRLPFKKPRHTNHADTEQQVRDKAYQVLRAANDIRSQGSKYHPQVENIQAGCRAIVNNPYSHEPNVIKLPPRRPS